MEPGESGAEFDYRTWLAAHVDELDRTMRFMSIANPDGSLPKPYWGRGPWQREPDQAQWRHAGFLCCAMRGHVTGALCGYVGVPGDHPLFGMHARECVLGSCTPDPPFVSDGSPLAESIVAMRGANDDEEHSCDHLVGRLLDVHGGINWANPAPSIDPSLWFFGFDCGHAWDYSPAMEALVEMVMPPEHIAMKRSIARGPFAQDRYRSLVYVRAQVNSLARQLRLRSQHAPRAGWRWPTVLAAVLEGGRG